MDLLLQPPERGRVTLDGQGCHHLPPISSSHGIEPHLATLINPDTTSALMSDTLGSRAEPPPFGWTDIKLETTQKYWNRCRSTRFTRLIMQGIRYEYKLIIEYMSGTTEDKV